MPEKVSRCRSCDSEIVWLKTKNGKNIPINITDEYKLSDKEFDRRRHSCHFDTCTSDEAKERRLTREIERRAKEVQEAPPDEL